MALHEREARVAASTLDDEGRAVMATSPVLTVGHEASYDEFLAKHPPPHFKLGPHQRADSWYEGGIAFRTEFDAATWAISQGKGEIYAVYLLDADWDEDVGFLEADGTWRLLRDARIVRKVVEAPLGG